MASRRSRKASRRFPGGLSGRRHRYGPSFEGLEDRTLLDGDRFEPNDVRGVATLLNVQTGSRYFYPQSIHDPADVDWYRFTTSGPGQDAHFVEVLFAQGSIGLALYDQNGNLITRNDTGASGAQVSLDGQPAGTYYVEVYGLAGATCPDYTLHSYVPGADWAEPNETRDAAVDRGTIAGHQADSFLSLDRPGDEDWFRFATTGLGGSNHAVSLSYKLAQGDLDLELYDAQGSLLARSAGAQDDERISLADRPAGTYFVRVFSPSGGTNPVYSLTYDTIGPDWQEPNGTQATARDLGAVIPTTGGWYFVGDLSIDRPADVDWFRFTTTRAALAGNFVRIDGFEGNRCDLDLTLFDAAGRLLAASETAADFEQVGLGGLVPGTYYVRVAGYNGATCPKYVLGVNLPGPDNREPNDTPETAYDFGTVRQTFTGWTHLAIDGPTDVDWFRFTTSRAGVPGTYVSIEHQLADGDLDLELYDSSLRKLDSSAGAHDGERISLAGQPAGTYYAKVFGANGATNGDYNIIIRPLSPDLSEPNGTRATAYDFGPIRGHWQWHDLSIDSAADIDWFRFQTIAPAVPGNALNLRFRNAEGNLDLDLYDATGALITGSHGTGDAERIELAGLPAGVYYVRVTGVSGAVNPGYDFDLDLPWGGWGDTSEPNNTRAAATDLRRPQGETRREALEIAPGDEDWFRFETTAASVPGQAVRIDFDHRHGALVLELRDASGTLLATSAEPGSDRQQVSLAGRPAGVYYVHVFGADGAANPVYDLALLTPRQLVPDWAEANDDPAHLYDLRIVQGLQTWAGLSIDRPGDADWFSFVLAKAATDADVIALAFNHAIGSLAAALYDASGAPLSQASGPGDRLTIPLTGLAAGRYVLRITGADAASVNPSYALTIQAPPAPKADAFEPNDTPATPTALGTISGQKTWTGLSINVPGDDDWFRFTTVAAGTSDDSVQVIYDRTRGTPQVELYDATGRFLKRVVPALVPPTVSYARTLAWSWLPAPSPLLFLDAVRVPLQDLPAGTFLVRVAAAYGNGTVPDYALTISAPPVMAPDWAGSNHTRQTAYDLGRVEGSSSWANLTIDAAGQEDWFRFQLPYDGLDGNTASLSFSPSRGDLDLSLWDATGALVASSAGTGGQESLSLKGLKAGTYYLQIAGFNGSTSPAYTLMINGPGGKAGDVFEPNNTRATAFDFGPLQGQAEWGGAGTGLAIADGGDEDWFTFRLVQAGQPGNFVRIRSDSTRGDLDLELYDSSGQRLATSAGLRDVEQISLNGRSPGTYSVRIFGYNGGSNSVYTLTINAPGRDRAEPNDSRAAAYDLRQVQGSRAWDGFSIDPADDQDWFRFELVVPGAAGSAVTASDSDRVGLSMALFDAAGQPVRDSNELSDAASVSLAGLGIGVYYVRVAAEKGRSTSYSLAIDAPSGLAVDWAETHDGLADNNTQARATDLKLVQGLTRWDDPAHPLTIDRPGDEDWFRFELAAPGLVGHFARIDTALAEGDLDLELRDSQGLPLAQSATASSAEQISLAGLAAGAYFLRVLGYNGATSPRYVLTINAPSPAKGDTFEPNESRATATDLRTITGGLTVRGLSIHRPGDTDWFRFETELAGLSGHSVTLDFAQAQGDLDLTLYDAQGIPLRTSAGVEDGERISLAGLPAGTYFVQVVEADALANPSYSLTFLCPGKASGDWAEPDNSQSAAKDLRQVAGIQQWTGLSVHAAGDLDWFRFELVDAGVDGNFVAVEQALAQGQLDLTLYDGTGRQLDQASDAVDFQRISLAGRAAGVYYVKIAGHGTTTTSPNYALWINAPYPPGTGLMSDWAEPNDGRLAARELGQVKGSRTWGQLSINASGNDDWFRFGTIATGVEGQYARIDFKSGQGRLGLALVREDGATVATSEAASDRQQVSLAGLAAGTYFLRIYGVNGATNPLYNLTINAPARPERDWAEAHAGQPDNNTPASAFDLREVSEPVFVTELSIHPAGDEDWFRFVTLADGTPGRFVRIDFDRAQGALLLELHDGSGHRLATAAGGGDFQQIALSDRPRGTYYVRIAGQNGATSPLYTLTINATPVPSSQGDWAETHDGQTSNDSAAAAYSLRSLQSLQAGKTSAVRDDLVFSALGDRTLVGNALGDPPARIPGYGGIGPAPRTLTGLLTNAALADFGAGLPGTFGGRIADDAAILDSIFKNPLNRTPDDSPLSLSSLVPQYDSIQSIPLPPPTNSLQDLAPILNSSRLDALNQNANAYTGLGGQFASQRDPLAALQAFLLASLLQSQIQRAQAQPSASAGAPGGSSSAPSPGSSGSRPPAGSSTSDDQLKKAVEAIVVVSFFNFLLQQQNRPRDDASATQPVTLNGLSINKPGDEDWFQFSLDTDAPARSSARIDFDRNLGQLILELRDAAGTIVDRASDVSDTERINLAGLPAGTYFLRAYAAPGATNPAYALTLMAPPLADPNGDWSEPSNTREAALDLGAIEGTTTLGGLSVHTATDADWFRFRTLGGTGGSVTLKSDPSAGDLDIALYDGNGGLIEQSSGRSASEGVVIGNRGPGTFYVKVAGYAGATNGRYSLVFVTPERTLPPDAFEPNNARDQATDIDPYQGGGYLDGLTITPGDHDYFRFSTGSTADITSFIRLAGGRDTGLVVEILDQNGNRVLPRPGQAPDYLVNLNGLPAGRYYAHVLGATAQVSGRYNLHFSVPPPQPTIGDWTIMVYMTAGDLAPFAFQDINEMEDAAARLPGSVKIAVLWDQSQSGPIYATGGGAQPAWGGAGQAIIQPDFDMETVATYFTGTFEEQNTGDPDVLKNFIAWAKQAAPARHYALIHWDHGQGVRGVNFDNADNAPADFLTVPEIAQALDASGTTFDVVAFDACKMAMIEVEQAIQARAGVIVGSQEIEGGGGYNYHTALLALQTNPSGVDARAFASGLVQSYQAQYQDDPRGADTLSAMVGAFGVGVDVLAATLKDFVSSVLASATAQDWPLIGEARAAAASFTNASDYRDLGQFLQALVDRNAISQAIRDRAGSALHELSDIVVARSPGRRQTSGLSIYLPAPGGTVSATYQADAQAFLDRTGWGDFLTRFVNQPRMTDAAGDWAEANDTRARAYNLHRLGGAGNAFTGLTLPSGDADWFRFFIPAPGTAGDRVAVTTPSGPPLRIFVEDAAGRVLAGSGGSSVSLSGAPAGEYFVRVEGNGTSAVSQYTLTINAPGATVPASDWARGNDQPGKAQDLGVIATTALFSGLALENGGSSWFAFATPRNPGEAPGRLVVRPNGTGSITARLVARDGSVLTSDSVGGAAWLAYPSGSGAAYQLEITGSAGGYTLSFTNEIPRARVFSGTLELLDESGLLDLGMTTPGTPVVRTLVVRNDGTAPLHLSGPIVLPPGFALASGFGATTLVPGAQTSFTIRFDAANVGPAGGAVRFGTDDPAAGTFAFIVSATAQGTPRAALLDGSTELPDGTGTLDLGQTFVGVPIERTLVIRNEGSAALDVTGVTIQTNTAGLRVASGPSASILAPGATASFVIRFDAAEAGALSGQVVLATNDPAHPAYRFTVLARAVPPPDTTPPTVTGVLAALDKRKRLTSVQITFSEPMNGPLAGSLASYRIVSAGRDRRFGTKDDKPKRLRAAVYDPATRTVTIRPAGQLALGQPLRLVINDSAGVTDEAGNRLDGNRDGRPGGDYAATLSKRGVAPLGSPLREASSRAVDRALEQVAGPRSLPD
jgi:hypothetical protein